MDGKTFLFPKSSIARDILPTELRHRGARVEEIVVYRTVPPEGGALDIVRTGLTDGSIQAVAFFSPSAVRNILQMLGSRCLTNTVLAAIGPTTASAVESIGLETHITSPTADAARFAEAIAEYFNATNES
jgi:uroporphyrinogen-III synthase